jgi:biotin synthase-related radical SAM superfamily protein
MLFEKVYLEYLFLIYGCKVGNKVRSLVPIRRVLCLMRKAQRITLRQLHNPMFITVSNSEINQVYIRIKTETLLSIGMEDSDDGTIRLRSMPYRCGKLNVN